MNLNQIENDGKRNLRRLQNVASGRENGETKREKRLLLRKARRQ